METDWRGLAAELALALQHSTPNGGYLDLAIGALIRYRKAWEE